MRDAGPTVINEREQPAFSCTDAERVQLLTRMKLSTHAKIDFFEDMIELAYFGGALSPQRLALRDTERGKALREGHFGAGSAR